MFGEGRGGKLLCAHNCYQQIVDILCSFELNIRISTDTAAIVDTVKLLSRYIRYYSTLSVFMYSVPEDTPISADQFEYIQCHVIVVYNRKWLTHCVLLFKCIISLVYCFMFRCFQSVFLSCFTLKDKDFPIIPLGLARYNHWNIPNSGGFLLTVFFFMAKWK